MILDVAPPIVTQDALVTGFRRLGVTRGMALEVHSSLSAFGHVVGGAGTVVTALMRAVGPRGALVMPAFPLSAPQPLTERDLASGVVSKLRVLDPDSTEPTGMGAVADAFRRRPDVDTGPGFFRVCAWGRDTNRHRLGLQHLLDRGGKALLLGVDIHRLSAMHYAEHRVGGLPEEITAWFAPGPELKARYPPDRWYVETGSTPEDGWAKVQTEAVRLGLVRQRRIGAAECMFLDPARVVAIYERALRSDPHGLFGVPRPCGPAHRPDPCG